MGRVRFPFHVKANGEYYAPGETVEVEGVEEAVAQGAEVIEKPKPEPPARGRKRKTE